MNMNDFVYQATYKGALQESCYEPIAKAAAVRTLERYKKNKFVQSVQKLIQEEIGIAKRLTTKRFKDLAKHQVKNKCA